MTCRPCCWKIGPSGQLSQVSTLFLPIMNLAMSMILSSVLYTTWSRAIRSIRRLFGGIRSKFPKNCDRCTAVYAPW